MQILIALISSQWHTYRLGHYPSFAASILLNSEGCRSSVRLGINLAFYSKSFLVQILPLPSTYPLKNIMAQSLDPNFAKILPKVELHAHLTGSISRQCLHEIWLQKRNQNPDFSMEDPLVAIPSAVGGNIDVSR